MGRSGVGGGSGAGSKRGLSACGAWHFERLGVGREDSACFC